MLRGIVKLFKEEEEEEEERRRIQEKNICYREFFSELQIVWGRGCKEWENINRFSLIFPFFERKEREKEKVVRFSFNVIFFIILFVKDMTF